MYLLTPDPSPDKGTALVQRVRGLGCACGGNCQNCAGGVGVFDSGLDLTQWGFAEWAVAGLAAIGVISVFSTGKRGVSAARASVRKSASKARRKRELQAELQRL